VCGGDQTGNDNFATGGGYIINGQPSLGLMAVSISGALLTLPLGVGAEVSVRLDPKHDGTFTWRLIFDANTDLGKQIAEAHAQGASFKFNVDTGVLSFGHDTNGAALPAAPGTFDGKMDILGGVSTYYAGIRYHNAQGAIASEGAILDLAPDLIPETWIVFG
jgi:hypothetical protein